MTVQPRPHEVKQIVVRTFLALGGSPTSLFGMTETVFRDNGTCLARCYRTDELRAVWFMAHGLVDFHDSRGRLLQTVNLLKEEVIELMAA